MDTGLSSSQVIFTDALASLLQLLSQRPSIKTCQCFITSLPVPQMVFIVDTPCTCFLTTVLLMDSPCTCRLLVQFRGLALYILLSMRCGVIECAGVPIVCFPIWHCNETNTQSQKQKNTETQTHKNANRRTHRVRKCYHGHLAHPAKTRLHR